MVIQMIRTHIVALDDWMDEQKEDQETPAPGEDDDDKAAAWTFNSIYLGSHCPTVSIATFIEQSSGDLAFFDFVSKLQSCMQDIIVRQHLDDCERDRTLSKDTPSIPMVRDHDLVRSPISTLWILLTLSFHYTGHGVSLRQGQLRTSGRLATSFGSSAMQSVVPWGPPI